MPSPAVRAGIFLLSLAGLLFQVTLTRQASATLNYHLAFLAVGAGVLGTGIGATWVACWAPGRPIAGTVPDAGSVRSWRLAPLAAGAGAGMALVGAAYAWLPLAGLGPVGLIGLTVLAYPALAAPYVCIGAALALALRTWPGHAGVLYGADLLGAGLGCLLAVPLMDGIGPPLAVAAAVLAASGAAPLLASFSPSLAVLSAGAVVVAVAAGTLRPATPNVLPSKPLAVFLDPLRYPGAERLITSWDATSRVDVFRSPGASLLWVRTADPEGGRDGLPARALPTGLVDGAPAGAPEVLGMTLDADALTAVVHRRPGEPLAFAGRLPASAAFIAAPRADVLVIGPGGGVDVAAALTYGATRVEAVEVNRGVAALMLGPLAGYSGDLFRDPAVQLVVDEGRSYLRRSPRRYDAVVLTAVDSWAALASGSYSLAESYLYTREAMDTYLDRLQPGGVVAISRWYTAPPREMQRLAAMAGRALAARGLDPSAGRLLLRATGRSGRDDGAARDFGTLIVRRGDFPASEVARVRAFGEANGFAVYAGGEVDGLLAAEGPQASSAWLRPATDDRPYFFDFVPWSDVLRGTRMPGGLPRGHAVLLLALLQGACLGIAGLVVPRKRLPIWCRGRVGLRLGAYAGAAGLAFMLAEMALLQRLTLLLGQPGLSLAVALAGLLAGAGLGAARWRRPTRRPLLLAAVLLAGSAVLLPALWDTALGWPTAGRLGLALGAGLLPALAMGQALPAGAARLGRGDPAVLPWIWGVNGAASAIGAALAVMLAMEWGGRAVLLIAALLYLGLAGLLGGGSGSVSADGAQIG